MGSTPIESTPAGGNSCGAQPSWLRSMHLGMRIPREGRKVNDLTTPCTGLALWTLNGFNKKHRSFSLSVDGSVREPMKGVPSCDKLREGAGSL
jgi:hypothetical protein